MISQFFCIESEVFSLNKTKPDSRRTKYARKNSSNSILSLTNAAPLAVALEMASSTESTSICIRVP